MMQGHNNDNNMQQQQQQLVPPAKLNDYPYLSNRSSQMSLPDQYSDQNSNHNNNIQNNAMPSGFTDIPSLNYPSTPSAIQNNNQNMLSASPEFRQQSPTPQPPQPHGLYKLNNNSQNMLNNNQNVNIHNHSHVSPGQYSMASDYNTDNDNSRSNSPFLTNDHQYFNSDSINKVSPIRTLKSSQAPHLQHSQQQHVQHVHQSGQNNNTNGEINSHPSNYMYFERRPDLLSKSTQDKAAAVKLKIENFYQSSVKYAIERNQRRVELETQLTSHDWSDERKKRQLNSLGKKESQFLRLRRTRLSLEDFQTVKVIGKGAFGEVRLVQKKDTGKIYAMKTLLKSEMYKKDQLAHVKAERDVLAGSDSPWVVSLYYSFQDTQYLYLIMEFLPGGDLMTMLIRWQIFTEDVTRFYMAECILAIEAIHKLGFIHRDIKPDNILIDIRGHIKLSDFGLSTGFHKTHDSNYYKTLLQQDEQNAKNGNPQQQGNNNNNNRQSTVVDSINLTMSNRQQIQTWRKSRRLMAYSTVGTPDYIAPEIFLYQGYGQECDWWSLGAIMYECLIGWPPFCSETPQETYRKIMNFEQTLQFPDDIHISYEAEDLIRRLLTHADQRLGRHNSADELKSHPFFRGVDWNSIRQVEAPYIPKLSSITDTRFFPTDELENVPDSPAMAQAAKQREQMMKQGMGINGNTQAVKEDLPFIGYTYSRFDYLTRKNAI